MAATCLIGGIVFLYAALVMRKLIRRLREGKGIGGCSGCCGSCVAGCKNRETERKR